MRRILVLRGGALGDFIVTLPALALLRQRWPAARIELAGNARAAALAVARGLLDTAHSQHEARWGALFGRGALPEDFAHWLEGFDLVVNYWPDPEGELRARFPLRKEQVLLSAAAMPTIAPAAAHYSAVLRELGLEPREVFHPLAVTSVSESKQRIAIHPGSGSPRKNWPLDRWAALAAWLQRDHAAELLIVTGEAERPDTLAEFGTPANALPLEELVNQLRGCISFLGHDSGISHLAAACGVPCLLLFGPTDPAMWAPPAPHVRVLRRGADLESISLADVQVAATSMLAHRR
jgi:heptosyltransferase-3